MSDTPQGPDWWQASDDKWYPPPRPEMPGEADTVAAPVGAGYAPPAGPPTGPPTGPPMGGPSGGYAPVGAGPGAPGPGPGPRPRGPGFPPGAHSPDGGVPAGPGRQQPNRTPLYVALGGVAAAVVVGSILLLSSGGDDPDPPGPRQQTTEAAPTTRPPTSEPATVDVSQPDDGGGGGQGTGELSGLSVTDSGFTAFDTSLGPSATYGLIIHNSGSEPIESFNVNVDLYDNSDALFHSWSFEVGRIEAGADLGIGEQVLDDVPNGVSDMKVAFEDEEFADPMPPGTLTLEGEVGFSSDDFATDISYTASSTYGVDLEFAHAYAILRDANNKIVGAHDDFITKVPANGKTADSISVPNDDIPPGVTQAEVYVDAGTIF